MGNLSKSIERRFRSLLFRLLRRGNPRAVGTEGLALSSHPRILLIRHDRIGDVFVTTPLISLLRERFPDAHITLLLGPRNASAARLVGGIDEVVRLPRSLAGTLRTMRGVRDARYDLAIHTLCRDSASGAMLTLLSGAGIRIGFDGEHGGIYDYPVTRPDGPMHIARTTSLLLAPLGIDAIGEHPQRDQEYLAMKIPPDANAGAVAAIPMLFGESSHPRIILNISGSDPSKFWGVKNFTQLASNLGSLGYQPFIACAPVDRAYAENIAQSSGSVPLPAVDLAMFAAMLSQGHLIVTPDTSVIHLGAALRKPVVGLVASESAATEWYPWGTPYRLIRHNQSVTMIAVASVLEAILELLPATSDLHPTSTQA